jgi:hypothetical protein
MQTTICVSEIKAVAGAPHREAIAVASSARSEKGIGVSTMIVPG